MNSLDDVLKHYGVKGMKWGVIRNRNKPGGADGKKESAKKGKSKLAKNLDSMKRERQWSKVLKDVDKLSTADINTVTRRVRLENDLKTLSKSKVGTKKDKDDYLRREKMSDDELRRKVTRLRAKDGLHKSVRDASKEQREFGEKVVDVTKAISTKYALKKVTGKPMEAKDIVDIISKPKETSKNAQGDLQKEILKKIERKSKRSGS